MSRGLTCRRVTAVGWVKQMEGGGSRPQLFESDDQQRLYVAKDSNNPQGLRVLVNELVVSLCLDFLGVEHPAGVIIDLPRDLLAISPETSSLGPGEAFGSEFWASEPGGALAGTLLNPSDVAGTLALDTWIRSHDARQYRLRLMPNQPGYYQFFPVDHGHYFGNPDWVAAALDGDTDVSVPAALYEVEPADVAPFVVRLRDFGPTDAATVVAQVPEAWGIAPDERRALRDYLVRRAPLAEQALTSRY